jgi:hypothetical protein
MLSSDSKVKVAIYPSLKLVGHFSLLGRYSFCVFRTVGVGDGELDVAMGWECC